ncbi:hypothetical protein LOK49_LG09G01497 [Camellia lanceoleosa]|uniref:Uncharacterized protein n=1 Tax=Camellia lanceoleosa TaxID=1840588 RepID=A0ACC0GG30_9ERIC|nr:hypothetical protein LOK49_LG09G01497 [Camellia lanceoleosa]
MQERATDWDENWDKFEDEGFTFVKELTLNVENVVALPNQNPLQLLKVAIKKMDIQVSEEFLSKLKILGQKISQTSSLIM